MKVSDLMKALQGCEDFDISFSFQMPSGSFPDIHAVSNIEIQDIAYSDKKVVLGTDDPIPGMQSVVIPLSGGKQLVAEVCRQSFRLMTSPGHDPHYPREIFVFQRNADGTEQDIAYVGQKYDAMIEYEDGKYHILTADQYGDFDEPQEDVEIPDIENEEGKNNEQVQRNHLRKDV